MHLSKRVPRISRNLLRAPAISLASQVTGLVQLGLILLRAHTNQATDAYFYLFNLGMVPIFCVTVGMMYPALLNEHRMSRTGLNRIRRVTPFVCLFFVLGGSAWLRWHDRLGIDLLGIAALTAANSVVQTFLWFRSVAAEAGGNALWISGVALPANVAAVLSLVPPWPSPAVAMTVMVGGLLVGNLIFLAVLRHHRTGDAVIGSAPEHGAPTGTSFWFLSMSSFGYVGQALLQSLAVLLPPSTVTLLNVGYKIVGSTSATFVNASMPALIHQNTESPSSARRFLRIACVVVGVGGALFAGAVRIVRPELAIAAVVIGLWLVTSSASAVAARMSYRFLPPRATLRTMLVIVVVVTAAILSSHGAGFDLTVLLCAYAAIDGGSAMLLLWPLRDRLMSLALGCVLAGLTAIWVGSYLPR